MKTSLTLALIAALSVSGCSRIADSRLNPFNWFGPSQPVANVDADGNLRPLVPGTGSVVFDQRGAIDQISSMSVERTPEGAIVRATGIASTQGQFNAQLVPVQFANGVLTLAFRVEAPAGFSAGGTDSSRSITVARALSNAELAGVRVIRVQGARNAREARR